MPIIGPSIADSAQMTVGYAHRLLDGVTTRNFARFAVAGNSAIESNHPAFILGHLSLYPCRILTDLGADASGITPSEHYSELFSPAAKCVDDPDGNVYPEMDEVVGKFDQAYKTTIEYLRTAEDAAFIAENPNERMRSRFPTLASMHSFYLGGHGMIHIGQFSAWRRAMGLGSA